MPVPSPIMPAVMDPKSIFREVEKKYLYGGRTQGKNYGYATTLGCAK
jgi:hypothetical protein